MREENQTIRKDTSLRISKEAMARLKKLRESNPEYNSYSELLLAMIDELENETEEGQQ